MEPYASYDRDAYARWHQSLEDEHDYWIDEVAGDLPKGLEGTYFRNGPGLLGVGAQRFHHPFDGDGMIARMTFFDGKVHFKNRFIQTDGLMRERAAGKILYRGVFGTQKPGGFLRNAFDLKFKNVANTNVIYWNHKLYCLWEGAEPYVMDPGTLATMGIDRLNGVLKPNQPFSAHPKIDFSRTDPEGKPRYVSFSAQIMGPRSKLLVFEFSSRFQLLAQADFQIPGIAVFHDFLVTENFYVFLQGSLSMNPIPFLLGFKGAAQCLKSRTDKPSKIVVISRSEKGEAALGGTVRYFDADPCFVFHHVMAEELDGGIRFFSVAYTGFQDVGVDKDYRYPDFSSQPGSRLRQFDVDFSDHTVRSQTLNERACEFPFVYGYPGNLRNRYACFAASRPTRQTAPLQAVMRYDFEDKQEALWCAEDHQFLNEPISVPNRHHRHSPGWIIDYLYDGEKHRTELLVFEEDRIALGPVARVPLKHHLPPSLHGSFVSEVFVS